MLHKGETAMKIMLGVCSVFIALVLADAPAALPAGRIRRRTRSRSLGNLS